MISLSTFTVQYSAFSLTTLSRSYIACTLPGRDERPAKHGQVKFFSTSIFFLDFGCLEVWLGQESMPDNEIDGYCRLINITKYDSP